MLYFVLPLKLYILMQIRTIYFTTFNVLYLNAHNKKFFYYLQSYTYSCK